MRLRLYKSMLENYKNNYNLGRLGPKTVKASL